MLVIVLESSQSHTETGKRNTTVQRGETHGAGFRKAFGLKEAAYLSSSAPHIVYVYHSSGAVLPKLRAFISRHRLGEDTR